MFMFSDRPILTMPELTVGENRDFQSSKCKIGFAENVAVVFAVS